MAEADKLFGLAVDLARQFSEGEGLAAVLQAGAQVLYRMRDDRAAEVYREALDQEGLSLLQRGVILDNLSHELLRQERVTEAIEHARRAVAVLAEADAPYDHYKALINLAQLTRGTNPATATEAFTAAHALIHRLHADVDAEHYTNEYRRQREAVNREIERRLNDPDVPSLAHPSLTP